MPLIERSNSVLVVIYVQDNFLDKLALHETPMLVSRIGWLMQVATVLDIPMIATAEDGKEASVVDPTIQKPIQRTLYKWILKKELLR